MSEVLVFIFYIIVYIVRGEMIFVKKVFFFGFIRRLWKVSILNGIVGSFFGVSRSKFSLKVFYRSFCFLSGVIEVVVRCSGKMVIFEY